MSADEDQVSDEIEEAAQTLYGLIHARYVVTNQGMNQVVDNQYSCVSV